MNMTKLTIVAAWTLLLGACGGGSSSPAAVTPPPAAAQPTPVTAVGKLTGFGSVYVNGVEYETDSASYEADDRQGSSDDDFTVGMVVTVKGSINLDGVSGTADSVSYDDDIEGPVVGIGPDPADPGNDTRKSFTVFGVQVVADGGTVFEAEDDPAFSFATIANGDNVEVSGVYHGDILLASYVEKQDAADDDFEVEGTISAFDSSLGTFILTLANGGTIDVTLAAGATIPSAGIIDNQYVEVEGTIPDPVGAPAALLATKVELEDEDHFDDQDDEVDVKGPLTHTVDTAAEPPVDTWSVNGTVIAFSDNTEYEPATLADAIADGSADGIVVEVEGHFADGVLQADEVKNEDDDIELKAIVSTSTATDAKNGTITLSFGVPTATIDVIIDGSTFFKDDDSVAPFDLTALADGTRVEISARLNAAGDIVASKLEIEDGTGIKIEGKLDAIDATSVTVLGVMFITDTTTMFPDGTPTVDQYVSVEDDNEDGTADSVEIED